MLSVKIKPIMLNVVKLSVALLKAVAPVQSFAAVPCVLGACAFDEMA
jgi:hypothetical protein